MIKRFVCLVLLTTFTSCAQQGEDSIRLLPEGYEGPVIIIFNQKDGLPLEYEDGKRVYRIPNNGVLRTRFKPNYGIQNHEFFYINEMKDRTEIPFIFINEDRSKNKLDIDSEVFAYLEKTIGESFAINAKGEEQTLPPARTFYIGGLSSIEEDSKRQLNFTFKFHKPESKD